MPLQPLGLTSLTDKPSPSPFPVALRNCGQTAHFAGLLPSASPAADEAVLRDYLQLEPSLAELYRDWAEGCGRMRKIARSLPGVRVLRQDPFECLVSFVCSSNNNVKRIRLILDRIRRRYGSYLCSLRREQGEWQVLRECPEPSALPEDPDEVIHLYSFPDAATLAAASEEELRALGAGYRARYITGTAKMLLSRPKDWLLDLRQADRRLVQSQLLQLPGVGRKVADCVALFALDQTEAVPVDTHVWDIALRDYDASLRSRKSLTPAVYEAVGDVFRARFPRHTGWAHSVLFAAELPEFRSQLPDELREEMAAYSAQRKKRRSEQAESSPDSTPVKALESNAPDFPSSADATLSASVAGKGLGSKPRVKRETRS